MADVTVTAASVVPGSDAIVDRDHIVGETITAGQSVYLKASDQRWWKAQCDGTVAEAAARGIALSGGSAGQPAFVQTGGSITIGGTLVAAGVYVVSTTYGGIAPIADLGSTNYLTILGYAISLTVLQMTVNATGVQK